MKNCLKKKFAGMFFLRIRNSVGLAKKILKKRTENRSEKKIVKDQFDSILAMRESPDSADVKSILQELKTKKIDLEPLPLSFLVRFFSDIYEKVIDDAERSSLAQVIQFFDENLLQANAWLALYRFSCLKGLFHSGFHLRMKARSQTIAVARANSYYGNEYVSACLEANGASLSENRKLIKSSNLSESEKRRFLAFACFELDASSSDGSEFCACRQFRSYLGSRSIALVGPSSSTDYNTDDIDEHDEVVRLNHSTTDVGCGCITGGTLTTITYFNSELASYFVSNNNAKLPDYLKFCCVKDSKSAELIAASNCNVSVRQFLRFERLVYNGALNMGPIVALDLAVHSNAVVKIYQMDLMLTVRRFDGYYPNEIDPITYAESAKKFVESSITHDPVSQYIVLKRMFDHGKISGDASFCEVMEMGPERFMQELELCYIGA